jgi:hypothetical protein
MRRGRQRDMKYLARKLIGWLTSDHIPGAARCQAQIAVAVPCHAVLAANAVGSEALPSDLADQHDHHLYARFPKDTRLYAALRHQR